jgi:hypothetical protein
MPSSSARVCLQLKRLPWIIDGSTVVFANNNNEYTVPHSTVQLPVANCLAQDADLILGVVRCRRGTWPPLEVGASKLCCALHGFVVATAMH